MKAALDPFWQILSGDLNPVRNLLIISSDAFKNKDMRLLVKCRNKLRGIYHLVRRQRGQFVGLVYRLFFKFKVKACLSKAMLWARCLEAQGLHAPLTKAIGPRKTDGSFK